ncbi:helix-turn-helix domain-containing protein [Lacticaseibacillus paracasei]|uniref:helix-turn-helix domain-containing protein n=1 Tax=Lacticaseibacillus paracasei TaxID=1597 RepID=UPI003993F763
MVINIFQEFSRSLQEEGLTRKSLAARIHVTQAAISNWEARGIPNDKLIPVALAIGNDRFLNAVIEYQTGLRVFADDLDTDDPLVVYLHEKMSQKKFKESAERAESVLSKGRDHFTATDVNKIRSYIDSGESLVESLESLIGSLKSQIRPVEKVKAWM